MINTAHILLWGAALTSAAAFLAFALTAAFGWKRARTAGTGLLAAALIALTASLGLRWAETGHGPYLGNYEALASYGWVLIAVFLAVQWRFPPGRALGLFVAPVALMLLGAALLSPSAPQFPSPAMRSLWLWLHVGMAKVALASLVMAGGTSWVYLRRMRFAADVEGWGAHGAPEHDQGALEELGVNLVSLGFLVLAMVLGSGALWANTAWGAYWNWDPIETWALATWIAYGLVLHMGRFGRASGPRWARLNLGALGFSAVLFVMLRLLAISPHWIYLS